ncbi:NDP-hexose-3-ketoreductase [Streptoalloteichus hindustanus]|uniref:NDP-hexose-3-ketoreductase n=1 Tax=Streptoalloteichus hindustanus TaxID=2017 RepID=A0A1M5I004_STRHI|nr:NDP-hexose-3-ketoreductase [Streptoalloteichus hindustanus]
MLGCASIAWRRTLPAIAGSEHTDIVAVASRDTARAERFAERFGGVAVSGYQRLLERADVEAVYLPLPTGLHAEWAARALRAGKHVLTEKPLASTAEQVAELRALADATGLLLRENRMFVHHPQHQHVHRLLADGAIGHLRTLTAAMAIPPLPDEDVRYRPELGGGALLDVGFYPLHTALVFLSPPVELVGAHLARDRARDVDVGGSALLCGGDGATAQLTFGFQHAYRSAYELWGERGRIVLERAFTPPPTWQPLLRIERQDRTETLTLPAADQFRASVERFAHLARGGGVDREHLDTATRAAALVDQIRARAAVSWSAPQIRATG